MRALAMGLACGLICAAPAWAQHEHEHGRSPYADQAMSEVRSLTVQELEELRNGEGMGMARPAELNSYPGPKHVLELADDLDLSPEQRARIEEIRAAMLSQAVRLGEAIIEAEGTLNRRFEHAHIDEATLRELTAEIARLYGELRYAHLVAHLATKAVLNDEQVATYDRIRGYAEAGDSR